MVYDFGNDGDVTGIRASFKEYDCTRSMKSGFRKGRHHVLPLPTSTKRVKFESSYNEWCQIIIASSLKRPVAAETAKNRCPHECIRSSQVASTITDSPDHVKSKRITLVWFCSCNRKMTLTGMARNLRIRSLSSTASLVQTFYDLRLLRRLNRNVKNACPSPECGIE